MARCFKILHRINSAYLTAEDIEAMENGIEIDPSDFDGPMDIVPVSDPAIFSETQRFAQMQAIIQRSQVLPQMYDQRKVEEMFLQTMKLEPDDLLQPLPGKQDMDPVSENVAASMGRPIYVLPKQDHLGHLMTHMAFTKSPIFGSSPVIVQNFLYPMALHLRDHLLNYYLTEAHTAVDNAEKQGVISDEASQQVQIILKVQQFIEQQLGGFSQELNQINQEAQQFKPQPQLPPDNSLQIAQINAQIQQSALQQRAQADQAKIQLDQQKLQAQSQIDQAKMQMANQEQQFEVQREMQREQADTQRTAETNASRERMNQQDNETAMRLAQAELLSNEKFSVSTGTGINPNP